MQTIDMYYPIKPEQNLYYYSRELSCCSTSVDNCIIIQLKIFKKIFKEKKVFIAWVQQNKKPLVAFLPA